jgi:hypothetical protein
MSVKRVLLTGILCLSLVLGFFQRGSAQAGNVCLILAYEEVQTFSNSECDSYAIGYGWLAVSPGLVKEFVKATSIDSAFWGDNVRLSLKPKDASRLWSPVDTRTTQDLGYTCPTGSVYRSKFRWNIGKLDPGTYNMWFFDELKHPVTDGMASCVDDQGQHLPNIIYSGTFIDNYTESITITP